MAVFEGKKSLNDIIINETRSDDEVVASDVPPRYLFQSCPPVCDYRGAVVAIFLAGIALSRVRLPWRAEALDAPSVTDRRFSEILRNLFLRIPDQFQTPTVVTAAKTQIRFVQIILGKLAQFGAELAWQAGLTMCALVVVVQRAGRRRPFETKLDVIFEPRRNNQMVFDVFP